MENETYKAKAHNLVQQAKEKGLVKKYIDFCESEIGKSTALSEEEMKYNANRRKRTCKEQVLSFY